MFLPNRIRVEILLPLIDNDGKDIDKSKLLEAGKNLEKEFKGYTLLSQAQGIWVDEEKKRYEDVNCGFYVVAPNTPESVKFFKKYKNTLMKKFGQKDILITYYPVETL